MNCLNPTFIKSPETRLLIRCKKEGRSFEYYQKHANVRRNLLLDPVPLIDEPYDYYNLHLNQRVQKVPCGKCDNCLKRKVNDYFVRCYFEYIDTNISGVTYFLTLTYADEILPKLDDGTPCFDSELIKRFFKRLRVYFERKLGYSYPIKYFVTSEYGGEYGRPHHHGLLFLRNWENSLSNLFLVKEAIAKSWTKTNERKDWYANTELELFDLQRVDVQPVENCQGIRYVCKYIGKQLGSQSFDELNIDYRFRRNHFQSIGLGSCLSKYVSADDFRKNCVSIDGFKYSLPLYYNLKLKREFFCYSDAGDIIFQPTCFARDSVREFTLERLQEYKDLSCLNDGFPECPSILYDPHKLALLSDWLDKYQGFELAHDFSSIDPIHYPEIGDIVFAINEFFDAVDSWYKPKYAAQASLFRKHQDERYKKSIFLK